MCFPSTTFLAKFKIILLDFAFKFPKNISSQIYYPVFILIYSNKYVSSAVYIKYSKRLKVCTPYTVIIKTGLDLFIPDMIGDG